MPGAVRHMSRLESPSYSPMVNTKLMTAIMAGTSRELPMPTVTRINSLTQAYATLQNCSYRLSRHWQGVVGQRASPIPVEERRRYQRWLEQWEQAFTTYLSQQMPGMKAEEITRCRILKANHLACTILAAEGPNGSSDPFEADYNAIVELAEAVLRSRARGSPDSSGGSSPVSGAISSSGALDVRDPLSVVAARCRRSAVRNHAVELLAAVRAR